MATRIDIIINGQTCVQVTFDAAARTMRYETELHRAGSTRAIGDAIVCLGLSPSYPTNARAEVAHLHARGAGVDEFAREIMRVVLDVFGTGVPENLEIDLGDWTASNGEIPPTSMPN